MRHPRSLIFDLGLAALGCFVAFPAVQWLWPLAEEDAWEGWPLLTAFVISYGLVRLVDRVPAHWGR